MKSCPNFTYLLSTLKGSDFLSFWPWVVTFDNQKVSLYFNSLAGMEPEPFQMQETPFQDYRYKKNNAEII